MTRRLAAESVTFSKVLELLRFDLAWQYLSEADLSILRIAWLLGYHEVSAFTHAFKRWTGKTAGKGRLQARHSQSVVSHRLTE
jgi:AraC-like DNA-binding protein